MRPCPDLPSESPPREPSILRTKPYFSPRVGTGPGAPEIDTSASRGSIARPSPGKKSALRRASGAGLALIKTINSTGPGHSLAVRVVGKAHRGFFITPWASYVTKWRPTWGPRNYRNFWRSSDSENLKDNGRQNGVSADVLARELGQRIVRSPT